MKKLLYSALIFFLFALVAAAQSSPLGVWKTVDDKSGEARSHIEIYQQGDKYCGKIIKLLQSEPGVVCEECSGAKKDQPVLGMVVLEDLEKYKDYWKGGEILDPESGNTYGCSAWFENGNTGELKVRGKHWTGLYRTQTWYRVD